VEREISLPYSGDNIGKIIPKARVTGKMTGGPANLLVFRKKCRVEPCTRPDFENIGVLHHCKA
jgi:hypothetical protein